MNANENKKLYIATVGTGASGADIAHALYFSINQQNPDLALFIVSKKTLAETFPFIEEKLKTTKPNLSYSYELIEEVNEFETLHKSYLSLIKKYSKQGFLTKNIAVDYTSGTKSMSAAIVSAGIAADVNTITYTYGERGEGGRVKSGSEKITSLSPTLFSTEKIIAEAIVLFNKNLFDASIEKLSSFNDYPHPDFTNKITFLIQLATALSYWDKFDFNLSFETLNKINTDQKLLDEAHKLSVGTNKLTQAANVLKEKKLNNYKVLELIANANRRAAEGKYDDAVARLYRALEMIGQIEFEKVFSCSTSDVILVNIPTEYRDEIKSKFLDGKDGKIKLPLYAAFDLLNKVGNKTALLFFDHYEQIKKVLHLRNNSILAHGSGPLSGKSFSEALDLVSLLAPKDEANIILPKFPMLK